MKLGIIDSAFQQAGVDTKSGLEHIARIGFDCVDIFTEALSISEENICLIEETCSKNNLPVTSLPVVSAGLIDFNEPVREFHLQPPPLDVQCVITSERKASGKSFGSSFRRRDAVTEIHDALARAVPDRSNLVMFMRSA